MATAVQKITLSSSRDIPFNKLVLSQSNVRRVKAGVSIEELAEDIARRTLLQSLNVRPVLDAEGETGMFEIPAGGRRSNRQIVAPPSLLCARPMDTRRRRRCSTRHCDDTRAAQIEPGSNAKAPQGAHHHYICSDLRRFRRPTET